MRRLRRRRAERGAADEADVGVGLDLPPRPALAGISEDAEDLAGDELAVEGRLGTRAAPAAPRVRRRVEGALGECGGFNLTSETRIGEVGR